MKLLLINSKDFLELSGEECRTIEGGSEFSEAIARTVGSICSFFYQCAVSEPIRPSTYR